MHVCIQKACKSKSWFTFKRRSSGEMIDCVPSEVRRSVEWQKRTTTGLREPSPLPVFSRPRRVYCVVDVMRAGGGKEECVTPIAPFQSFRGEFRLGEAAGSADAPVVCFRTAEAACRAPQNLSGEGLPLFTTRKLMLRKHRILSTATAPHAPWHLPTPAEFDRLPPAQST